MSEILKSNTALPKMILFDVYGTLLDMQSIRSRLNEAFHSKKAYRIWLEVCMQYTFVDIITGDFHNFSELSSEALKETGHIFAQAPADSLNDDILLLMKHAPLHEEVQEALSALADSGYRLAAFSNSLKQVLIHRMENTGLISYFDFILSAEDLGLYKPAPEAFAKAAIKAQLTPAEILMVTSHQWDVRGAAAAGMSSCLLQRSTENPAGMFTLPDYNIDNLGKLPEELQLTFGEGELSQ